MKITEMLNEMQEVLTLAMQDAEKFDTKGNAAAGTRVRKAMQDIKNLAQNVRTTVTEIKNEGK